MACIDGVDMEMEPDGAGVMWPIGPSAHLQQRVMPLGASEAPTSIRLDDFGDVEELGSVNGVGKRTLDAIAGRYEALAIGTHAMVCEGSEGPELRTQGRFGSAQYTLTCLGENIWRARSREVMPWGGILVFDERRVGFRFSTGRLRSLPFRRV
jgi:hypothetical protein